MFFWDLTAWSAENVIWRVVMAMVLGGVIGIDRGVKRRGGGARTDAAVCLGAAMVMITGQYMEVRYPGAADMARMASQVVSGVGFLGAGSIIVSGHQVKGLTSAAGVWVCACVGLAVGIGFVDGAILVTAVLLLGLHVLPFVEQKVYQYSGYMILYVEVSDSKSGSALLHKLQQDGCKVDRFEVDRSGGRQSMTIMLTIRIPRKLDQKEYLERLELFKGILSLDSL